jgi:proline racemase
VQESIIGSTFRCAYRWLDRAEGKISPLITGSASINAEITQILDERDPYCWGIR